LPRAADLAGAERRSGPIRKAATGTARRAAAEPTGAAAELARQSGRAATKTTRPIQPADIPRLRRGAIEATEISGLRGRPRHRAPAHAPHAGPADAATDLAGLRRGPVGGAWE
jgi:hypothetical protein